MGLRVTILKKQMLKKSPGGAMRITNPRKEKVVTNLKTKKRQHARQLPVKGGRGGADKKLTRAGGVKTQGKDVGTHGTMTGRKGRNKRGGATNAKLRTTGSPHGERKQHTAGRNRCLRLNYTEVGGGGKE